METWEGKLDHCRAGELRSNRGRIIEHSNLMRTMERGSPYGCKYVRRQEEAEGGGRIHTRIWKAPGAPYASRRRWETTKTGERGRDVTEHRGWQKSHIESRC